MSNYLSDLGGSIGLWIGMSLFTVFEFFEFLMDIVVLTCSKLCRKRSKVEDIDKGHTDHKRISGKETLQVTVTRPMHTTPISPPPPYSAQSRTRVKSSGSKAKGDFTGRVYGDYSAKRSNIRKQKRSITPVQPASPGSRFDTSKVTSSSLAIREAHEAQDYSFGW